MLKNKNKYNWIVNVLNTQIPDNSWALGKNFSLSKNNENEQFYSEHIYSLQSAINN